MPALLRTHDARIYHFWQEVIGECSSKEILKTQSVSYQPNSRYADH